MMTTQRRSIWETHCYAILRLYMTLVGIWPYHTIGTKCLRFVTTFTFSFSILIPQVLYLLNGSIGIDDIFECVASMAITILLSFKLVLMMINDKKIKACFKRIEEDWLSLNTDTEKAILRQYTEYGQYLTKFYAIIMLVPALSHILRPFIMTLLKNDIENITKSWIPGASKLPYRVEYGEKLNQHFYLIMLHCCLAVFAHLIATVAVNGFYYTAIQHACGMFSIIGHMLENIGKNDDANFHLEVKKVKDDNYNMALNCLRRHLRVLEFAKLIESIFTNMFLLSVNMYMLVGSLCGIQVIMNLNNSGNIAAPLTVYFAQLAHLFLQFWQGQFLLSFSDVPYESICRGRWYCTSRKCKKILLLIMSRTMLPCKITAGKIMTLSIESFSAVLKTSISYFTVLRSFQ
ncbi:odorant receptor 13a-like [Cataglyphis hispanica]|uniref:odorant receptor 13a-like n=1 Tax=Cataglyphis hispanica TaxID=1086592 RepID=UPI0021808599|nr:odorant receptor 13a-like [Cataglyphis hispanica]